MIFLGLLAQSDFFGSMKDARIFWVAKEKQGFFWVAKKGLRDFLGYVKKNLVLIFLGRQILKL